VRGINWGIGLLLLLLPGLACVNVQVSSAPPVKIVLASPLPQPTATPLVWPTLSPRPTPELTFVLAPSLTLPPECLQPPVPAGQHSTPTGDTTTREKFVVGPMLCHVQPGSCAYNLLVGKPDPDIVFKREEPAPYDLEDMLIHPALVQPLTRLHQLVQAEWGGAVKLRVTDAYDSLLSHDPANSDPATRYSLHYEGRAIDLTTWPVDRSRYDRLCALALCAGFDWVHNEETHCHASVTATSLCTECQE
jgi:hypothetical protein